MGAMDYPHRTALVRRPGPRLAEGLLTHLERTPVDVDLARRQWEAYVAVLVDEGWDVVEVPPADDCPDAVFVEDAVVVHGDLAVLGRSGALGRRAEVEAVEGVVRELGYRVAHVEAPETLDGGDVLEHDGTLWVGTGGRTTPGAVRRLADLLAPLGARVVDVPLGAALHLKSAVTALPDGTVLGWEPVVADPTVWPRFRAVPEEPGCHVVPLDATTVLMAASAPRTRAALEADGLRVLAVDIGELERLEGCVTCLSVRLPHGRLG